MKFWSADYSKPSIQNRSYLPFYFCIQDMYKVKLRARRITVEKCIGKVHLRSTVHLLSISHEVVCRLVRFMHCSLFNPCLNQKNSHFHGSNTGTYTTNACFRQKCKSPFVYLERYIYCGCCHEFCNLFYLFIKSRIVIPV